MFQKGQRLEFDITDTADGQKCFGKLPDGMAVFVGGAAAVGDRVAATVCKIKKNYLETKLAEVLSPSPVRVAPVCPHFGICGGCKWQHVDYSEQLRIKRKLVADALAHLGGFKDVPVAETIPSPRVYGYRNKLDFSFGDRRYLLPGEMDLDETALEKPVNFALGFHTHGIFDKVIDIDACHLAPPEMTTALDVVKEFARGRGLSVYNTRSHEGFLRNLVVRHAVATDRFMVILITSWHDAGLMRELDARLRARLGERLACFVNGVTTRKNNVAYCDELHPISGVASITERLGRFEFAVSPNSFFQTNTLQAERLYAEALRQAELGPADIAYDLYCGTGTIALFMAGACRQVIGFEQEASAVADAVENARRNSVTNCRFIATDLKHFGARLGENPDLEAADVVVTDPPRAGMHPKTVERLRELRPRAIVYVSCNPASLARDGQLLCAEGSYSLEEATPVDLFPHTYHVESVARFRRQ